VADVKKDVHVLLVLKIVIEAHDMLVVELAVDLDLAGQLLASFTFDESSLGNYF